MVGCILWCSWWVVTTFLTSNSIHKMQTVCWCSYHTNYTWQELMFFFFFKDHVWGFTQTCLLIMAVILSGETPLSGVIKDPFDAFCLDYNLGCYWNFVGIFNWHFLWCQNLCHTMWRDWIHWRHLHSALPILRWGWQQFMVHARAALHAVEAIELQEWLPIPLYDSKRKWEGKTRSEPCQVSWEMALQTSPCLSGLCQSYKFYW